MSTRREHDLLGDREVPADVYWGVHTLRAVENFPISGVPIGANADLVVALATIKQAAAEANRSLGLLDARRAGAIVRACVEIRTGQWHDQFVVDAIQGGAGTSTNMNANEVIANRALELIGRARGEYTALHPNEHVNLGQSTNDVYPTAVKLAAWAGARRLAASLAALRVAFAAKAVEFADVLKIGRTQLQDAVPMTLGQEFGAYATTLAEDEARLAEAVAFLRETNLGATAIGTGITAHPAYAEAVRARLSTLVGVEFVTAPDLIEATQDCGVFVLVSGVLKRIAVKLSKICNDLRLLSSGPRAGFNEINLPVRQAGSSIMPGKVNPVIPEVVNQIAFEVIGNDLTITLAAEAGQLQLNAFEPIVAHSLHKSIEHLRRGIDTLTTRCVAGITANRERLADQVRRSVGIVTALNPYLGYARATELAAEVLASGSDVREVVARHGLLSPELLDRVLAPEALTRPVPVA
ncbi:aspartate ammonia-lyase [Tahibacter soli]|uniref:Aspartate ammonia-lyase n=1 Tax=Tahibacter soli TaxID=2983605 RepID=A0A9X3YQP3_9GAMM|nr:aspartate ammonia-lyase [Tahibacter soli]MDC8016054.1 aspartate ammonia-lyase [Tahibacter soli]